MNNLLRNWQQKQRLRETLRVRKNSSNRVNKTKQNKRED